MPPEPQDPVARNGTEDSWEGLPLQLEGRSRSAGPPSLSVGEETVERRLTDLVGTAPHVGGPDAWLNRWLLLAGIVAMALALASIVAALSLGARPVDWKGPLVAFDCAAIVLIVRSFLAAGTGARVICHRLFSVAGLAAASLVILGALLQSASGFIHGRPRAELLTGLLVFGLLGVAAAMMFVRCLQGRGWACRTASVASAAFVVLLACQPFTGFGVFTSRPALPLGTLRGAALPSLAIGSCALGLLLMLGGARRSVRHRALLLALAWVWLLLLTAATTLATALLAGSHGAAGASARLWTASVAWASAALVPLLVAGAVLAWFRRGPAPADMHGTTSFVCSLVAVSGLVCLALWAVMRLHSGALPFLLVATGVLAALTGAWLTETSGDWVSRWALVPAVGLAVAMLCAPARLLAFARQVYAPQEGLGRLASAYFWCLLVVALTFAAAGLLARRRRRRVLHAEEAAQDDVRLLCLAGWMSSGLSLAAVCALVAGDATVTGALRRTLAYAGALGRDLLILGAGRLLTRWLTQAVAFLSAAMAGPAFATIGAGLLLAVFAVHLFAASRLAERPGRRAHWSLSLVAALWMVALSAAALFVLLYASHLFLPSREAGLATYPGRFVSTHFAARLVLFIVLSGLLVRFWEAVGSVIRTSTPGLGVSVGAGRDGQGPPAAASAAALAESRHLRFLVSLGVLLAAGGLVLAILLKLTPGWEAALFELSNLARNSVQAGASFGLSVGRVSAEWAGYAAAAALTAFGLICIHEEGRRGRTEVYLLMGSVWTLLLVFLIASWVEQARATLHPAAPGRAAALAALAVILAGLSAAALALWTARRPASRATEEPAAADAAESPKAWAAHSLGSLGLVLSLSMCLAILHGSLAGHPGYDRFFRWAAERAAVAVVKVAAAVDVLKEALDTRDELGRAVAGLAFACLAVLLLNYLAARRVSWARGSLYLLWLAAALAGAAGIGYMVHLWPLGTWTAPQLFWGLLLAASVVRICAALLSPRSWLLPTGG
jgi:hypothetical protein